MGVPEVNNKDKISNCDKEATRLALKYNFVTDLTSLVIEEDDDYIKKGPIEIGKKPGLAQEGISPFFSSPKFALSASSFSAGFGGFKSSGPSRRRRIISNLNNKLQLCLYNNNNNVYNYQNNNNNNS